MSSAYTPQQNGVSERYNRTAMESTRCLLFARKVKSFLSLLFYASSNKLLFSLHLKVPIELWAEAANYSNYIRNRVLSSTETVTSYEIWFGKKPDLSHLRVFGSQVFIHIPDERRKKLDPKSMEGILVGYCDTSKAYRVWDPVTRKVKIIRDIRINEGAIPETRASQNLKIKSPFSGSCYQRATQRIKNWYMRSHK
jgi:hypothetical protein